MSWMQEASSAQWNVPAPWAHFKKGLPDRIKDELTWIDLLEALDYFHIRLYLY